jgi:hypothetical protein
VTSYARCSLDEIVSALDLAPSDLSFRVAAVASYRRPDHPLSFQVVWYSPERSRRRRPDGAGGWIWNLKGVEKLPYRLPELTAAVAEDEPWAFIAEGEKDVDRWWGLGLPATTSLDSHTKRSP